NARAAGGGKVIALDSYPSVPAVYRTVAERAVTPWANWDRFDPQEMDSTCVVVPIEWAPGESLKRQDLPGFVDVLCRHFLRWHRAPMVTGFELDAEGVTRPVLQRERATVVDATRYGGGSTMDTLEVEDAVFVFSSRGAPSEEFVLGLAAFADMYRPVAVVLTGWVVDDWIPEETPVLVSLGGSTQVASAVAQALAGSLAPTGSLHGLLPRRNAGKPRPAA
ncbi:MAG TPA: hypothetical protein VFH88_07955, partial [Candidatus Krumholzibacteria bacterium]|nr:hypothetical protein [Candidatus Krumholzibacteria bacterium]